MQLCLDFDVELWDLMQEGMEGWRQSLMSGAERAPCRDIDKARNEKYGHVVR